MYRFVMVFLLTLTVFQLNVQTGSELVKKSIKYHDPKGQWSDGSFDFTLSETRPNAPDRITKININNKLQSFVLDQQRGDNHYLRFVHNEKCQMTLDGIESTHLPAEEVEEHNMNCEYTNRLKNYYTYLYGLPMKLMDEGTIIDDEVEKVDFFGKELLQVRVTYDAAVGSDIWYFYFDEETHALSGYRFYHDEVANDGEYILLEGETKVGKLRIPRLRTWYTHQDARLLGTDSVVGGNHPR